MTIVVPAGDKAAGCIYLLSISKKCHVKECWAAMSGILRVWVAMI